MQTLTQLTFYPTIKSKTSVKPLNATSLPIAKTNYIGGDTIVKNVTLNLTVSLDNHDPFPRKQKKTFIYWDNRPAPFHALTMCSISKGMPLGSRISMWRICLD